ncbi:hypothetical protein [Chitinimonas lacunae]|uniref:Uncharacterized protein n=1 Tax=Chitinimonas lacunae TaxID=1963018 RepID=A0ABV8MWQ7_9NEIS
MMLSPAKLCGIVASLTLALSPFAQAEAIEENLSAAIDTLNPSEATALRAASVRVHCFRPWMSNTLQWGGSSSLRDPGLNLWVGLYHKGRLVEAVSDMTPPYTIQTATSGVDGSGDWEVHAVISRGRFIISSEICKVT